MEIRVDVFIRTLIDNLSVNKVNNLRAFPPCRDYTSLVYYFIERIYCSGLSQFGVIYLYFTY